MEDEPVCSLARVLLSFIANDLLGGNWRLNLGMGQLKVGNFVLASHLPVHKLSFCFNTDKHLFYFFFLGLPFQKSSESA